MSVEYYICNFLDSDNELIPKIQGDDACFAPLLKDHIWDDDGDKEYNTKNDSIIESFNPPKHNNPGHVIYVCNVRVKIKNIETEKVVNWYSKVLNLFGLTHTLNYNIKTKQAECKVLYYGSIMKMMVTLAALRYLEEDSFPLLIKWFYLNKDWAAAGDKNPNKEKLFILFQLCHWSINSEDDTQDEDGEYLDLNYSHSLVCGFVGDMYSEYEKNKIIVLSTLRNFHKNIRKDHDFYLNGVFHDNEKDIVYADLKGKKSGDIVKMLNFKGARQDKYNKIDEVVKLLKTGKK